MIEGVLGEDRCTLVVGYCLAPLPSVRAGLRLLRICNAIKSIMNGPAYQLPVLVSVCFHQPFHSCGVAPCVSA